MRRMVGQRRKQSQANHPFVGRAGMVYLGEDFDRPCRRWRGERGAARGKASGPEIPEVSSLEYLEYIENFTD